MQVIKIDVESIDPMGQQFDADLHEAMSTIVDDQKEDGQVVEVLQKGYKLRDRLIRVESNYS